MLHEFPNFLHARTHGGCVTPPLSGDSLACWENSRSLLDVSLRLSPENVIFVVEVLLLTGGIFVLFFRFRSKVNDGRLPSQVTPASVCPPARLWKCPIEPHRQRQIRSIWMITPYFICTILALG